MAAADSFVGDGLNPSPYKEAIARAEKAEAARDAFRALLRETLQWGAYGTGSTLADRIDAAIAAKGGGE